ncbi:ion transporter [Arundinibacter roseus]|uniref:Ion transporter n=1 Tax=Arundinibacter roseus TaxID=2070510 RepID=A0A4R4KBB6_9BACT|nr:ion transporter [Arundinibacter roseus]TDB65164.1 ion transporter [Arundinibacter roseus]
MNTFRKQVHYALAISHKKKRGIPLAINLFIFSLIALNSLAIVLHSVPEYQTHSELSSFFSSFEFFSVILFSIEYIFRVWSCVEQEEYRHPFWGRIRYMLSAWALIDLLAIFPYYLTFFTTDFGLIRMLRILRIVRLYRFSRYSHALRMIQKAILYTKEELILSYTFVLFALMIASSIIYFLENPAQPEAFPSIPASIWWGIVTMTTVGYGDVYPITALGKIFGGFLAVLGVALFSLPTGILASGFIEQINETKRKRKASTPTKCPHCGQEIEHEH